MAWAILGCVGVGFGLGAALLAALARITVLEDELARLRAERAESETGLRALAALFTCGAGADDGADDVRRN